MRGSSPSAWRRSCSITLRSEEHTSELQSPWNLVCRLLLEEKDRSRSQMTPCFRPAPGDAGALSRGAVARDNRASGQNGASAEGASPSPSFYFFFNGGDPTQTPPFPLARGLWS